MDEIHFATEETVGVMIPLQMPPNNGFNHGFKVVQDFVHPQHLVPWLWLLLGGSFNIFAYCGLVGIPNPLNCYFLLLPSNVNQEVGVASDGGDLPWKTHAPGSTNAIEHRAFTVTRKKATTAIGVLVGKSMEPTCLNSQGVVFGSKSGLISH